MQFTMIRHKPTKHIETNRLQMKKYIGGCSEFNKAMKRCEFEFINEDVETEEKI